MQSLAHYVLLGSLAAGAAGALVLVAVTLKHGFKRSRTIDDEAPEDIARRQRTIRLADTVAVLCFAVSAGLGVVGLMQHTRGIAPAVAASEDVHLAARLQALESKLTVTPAPEWRALEERLTRLESRIGAVEDRAAVAEQRAVRPRTAPVAATPRYIPPPARPAPAPSPLPTPGVTPRPSSPTEALVVPEPPAPAQPPAQPEVAPRVTAHTTTAAALPREVARPRAEPPPPQLSLGEKIRRDWETVKTQARRGGEDWRDGWGRMKGLFGY